MTTKAKAWLIGVPLALAGAWLYMSFERATLYQCTACFAEDPSRCVTHKDGADEYSSNEHDARIAAQVKLCSDNDGAKADACDRLPAERFNITCSSWRQWVAKHYANHFLVH